MIRWDRRYLDRLKKAGIDMKLFKRYIDDSNQAAVVPPPGAKYDRNRRKVLVKENQTLEDENENEDERLSMILLDIANDVSEEIQMERDFPSNHNNDKMPILDMEVWTDRQSGYIMYQHYEKAVASKKVLHAESAQSVTCKQSVHTQEVLRRLLNCSVRLEWTEQVAPVLSTYMARMMLCGYTEEYRKRILVKALGIYDMKLKEDLEGLRPLYRPKNWHAEERRKTKKNKRFNWSNRGGEIAPIFVPPTPNSELALELKKIAENEAESGVKFKVIETGGRTVKSILQKSNPTASPGCTDGRCLACIPGRGEGGNCRGSSTNYEVECQLCPEGRRSKYIGESSRNLFTRGLEHMDKYRNGNTSSFIKKHQEECHQGQMASFTAKVTGSSKDCLTRQVREAVQIRRSQVPVLNSKTEWHQPALWRIL